ncbi:hypothetical protein HDU99_003979 [Rhizoclosmatium hyalinum]|nr:hypothetical protein HDU99_003979 [Rhizoclosmatium hyalinum]
MRNVYRMLSLVQEQSSIGSVEKIVIEQNQFQTLCNKLVPGSYKSLAQVDYKALDSASLNLVGIYGNKEMIAQLMFEKGLFDQETLDKLLLSTNDKSKFSENIYWFASGIYLAFTESRTTEGGGVSLSGFAFFWPEDASWDDSANQSVVKNRVAFMRYLTKLTTGQFCLMSPNDVKSIDWTISSSKISHRKSQRNQCPPLRIPTTIDTADMKTLLDEGLSSHFPNEYSAYTNRIKDDVNVVKNRVLELRQELEALKPKIDKVVEREFIAAVTPLFHFEDEEGNVEDLTALTGLVLTQDNNAQNFLKSDKDTMLSQSPKVILMEETGADYAMSESSDSDDDMVIVEDDRMKVDQNDSKAGDYATDATPGIKEDLIADEMLEDGSETQDGPLDVDEIELLKDGMKRINISAIARDSQFIPLKDGIQTADVIGADFNALVKNLSLGCFQASSSVLDPEKNRPLLFNSYLAVIVRDVVPQDRDGIVQEFRSKIATIIYKEKNNNFISKLFGQKLEIVRVSRLDTDLNVEQIPWPVIQDSDFYEEFYYLKDILELQEGYKDGIAFLRILKTLMIKLKVADWSSIDSSMIQQRVNWLLHSLPLAFSHGLSELLPDEEPLMNLDTNEPIINTKDTGFIFLTDVNGTTSQSLLSAVRVYEAKHPRHVNEIDWLSGLESFIQELIDERVRTVKDWISANLAAFKPKASDVETLNRKFEEIKIDITGSLTLCKATCSDCLLTCVMEKKHDGKHDCGTNHKCPSVCEFNENHDDGAICGLKANHEGAHFCEISKHSCGLSCGLSQHVGCAVNCTKPAKHAESEHRCSSTLHKCGKPCSLSNVKTNKGHDKYSCPGVCALPYDQPHGDDEHMCSDTLACPIECFLCKRACATRDHFHGKADDSVHLCGQEHPCKMKCEDGGICKIEQHPQAVEAQFVGAHSTFTYTKQEQIAVKLLCCKVIPANQISHEGSHVHYADPKDNFHYCDVRYFCDRPRGHTQALHHTSHGNMIQTQWAFTDETGIVEVKGHKFGSGDGGAPLLCSMVCRDLGRHIHIE